MPSPNRKPAGAGVALRLLTHPQGRLHQSRDLAGLRHCGNIRSPRYPGCCPDGLVRCKGLHE